MNLSRIRIRSKNIAHLHRTKDAVHCYLLDINAIGWFTTESRRWIPDSYCELHNHATCAVGGEQGTRSGNFSKLSSRFLTDRWSLQNVRMVRITESVSGRMISGADYHLQVIIYQRSPAQEIFGDLIPCSKSGRTHKIDKQYRPFIGFSLHSTTFYDGTGNPCFKDPIEIMHTSPSKHIYLG